MAQTPKLWTAKQAHDYNGKNAISEFLVKRKLPVPPPIKNWGCGRPKKCAAGKRRSLRPSVWMGAAEAGTITRCEAVTMVTDAAFCQQKGQSGL